MNFIVAFQFLTMIPVPLRGKPSEGDFAKAMLWFPAVGALLGLVLAGTYGVLSAFFPPPSLVCGSVLAALLALLTGGLHLDGVADAADALFSVKGREERLRIMKDSHIGAMGAAAVAFTVVIKAALLAALPVADAWKALVMFPAASRCSMLLPALLFPYARATGGTARPFVAGLRLSTVLISSVATVAAATWLLRFDGTMAFLAALAFAASAGWLFRRLLGGVTGDALGSVNEGAELVFLAVLVALR